MGAQHHRITLPPEIRFIIVDILAGNKDIATIKALARTDSSMLHPCRSYIFAILDLIPRGACQCKFNIVVDPGFAKKLENVASLFRNNPHLAFYVRQLAYWIPSHMAYNNEDLQTILDSLSHIQTFYLSGELIGYARDDLLDQRYWSGLPLTIRMALEKVLHSSSLVELEMTCTSYFPLKVLAGCKNVSHLDLEQVDFQDAACSDDDDPGLHSSVLRLRSLISLGSFQGIQTLMSSTLAHAGVIDLTHLTTLEVFDRDDKNVRATTAILLGVSKCLESLHYIVSDSLVDPFHDILNTSALKTLKVFKTSIRLTPGKFIRDPLLDFTNEIDKWAGKNVLETISIVIRDQKCALVAFSSDNWTKLNDLAITDRFPTMQKVSVIIHLTSTSAQHIGILEKNQDTVFEKLVASDKVVFEFRVAMNE